jgi:hypothetical protein
MDEWEEWEDQEDWLDAQVDAQVEGAQVDAQVDDGVELVLVGVEENGYFIDEAVVDPADPDLRPLPLIVTFVRNLRNIIRAYFNLWASNELAAQMPMPVCVGNSIVGLLRFYDNDPKAKGVVYSDVVECARRLWAMTGQMYCHPQPPSVARLQQRVHADKMSSDAFVTMALYLRGNKRSRG